MSLLAICDLTHFFGGLCAVNRFSLSLTDGDLVGLIGPNGAGKTTVFNLISGIYKPRNGSMVFSDFDIIGLAPYKISRLGIARTFQNIRLFSGMSVIDTVKAACQTHVEYSLMAAAFHPPSFWREEERLDDYCFRLLSLVGLDNRVSDQAVSLPYGQQRRLELARALATAPKLLLLDEPAAGMNPQETEDLIKTIYAVKDEFKLTVLIIEHNMQLIMNISQRVVVMDFGEIISQGTPQQVRNDPAVIEAYLGKEGARAAVC